MPQKELKVQKGLAARVQEERRLPPLAIKNGQRHNWVVVIQFLYDFLIAVLVRCREQNFLIILTRPLQQDLRLPGGSA
eukprot:1111586-Pelagomonas_calceolata.AAC.6